MKKYMTKYMYERRHKDPVFKEMVNNHIRKSQAMKNQRIKIAFFEMIGGCKCVCSGENCWHKGKCVVKDLRCLNGDHINGKGNEERRRINIYGSHLYSYYLKHPKEAKKKLQPLCANCNSIKRLRDLVAQGKTKMT